MTFSSHMEAKRFLAEKITLEASVEGVPLSDAEQKLLLFSEEDPDSPGPEDIPDYVLDADEVEYEEKIIRLLRAAYKRDKDNPLERERYKDAMRTLEDSDHYIMAMAVPALSSPLIPRRASEHVARDLLIYVAIALAIVIAITLLAMWRG